MAVSAPGAENPVTTTAANTGSLGATVTGAAPLSADTGVAMTDRSSLTLVQMAVLEAVARCGGIGAAARDLGLSQPSVSNHVNQIETRLTLRLFVREGHRFRATDRLDTLLPRIRAILKLAGDLETALGAEAALETGRLTVGYSTHQFVMEVLAEFGHRHSGVRLEARCHGSFDLVAALRRGDLEAAFVTLPVVEPDLVCRLLRTEEIVLMVARDDPQAAQERIAWADLDNLKLIRREVSSGTRSVFDAAAAEQGAAPIPGLELGSWESMREAASLGMGPAVAMRGEIEPDDPKVSVLGIGPPAPLVGHYLVTLPELRTTATVDALFDVVDNVLETKSINDQKP